MTDAATVVDIAVNPNNTDQRYVFWNTGRIDPIGGAVPVTNQETWYGRPAGPPGKAIHVTDWDTGSGYTLDYRGFFHPFGEASAVSSGGVDGAMGGIPITPSPMTRRYVDWHWNPDGSGQGYTLDHFGELLPFGGATAPPRTGPRFTWAAARKLDMYWGAGKYGVQMDLYGALRPEFNATANLTSQGETWPGKDYARDFVVTDWGAPITGYKLGLTGNVYGFGAAQPLWGMPRRAGADVARKIAVISAEDPTDAWIVWSGGQNFRVLASTPPTVTAGGSDPVSPAASVTTTTRPILSWTYFDSERDTQNAWELYVYTETFAAAHSMTDPSAWAADAVVVASGSDPNTRGIPSPVDLSNIDYREYVRAQDTAEQWSAWDEYSWSQDVPLPTTPTALTVTSDEPTMSVLLSAHATIGEAADLVRFEFSDDDEETWRTVRGAGAVPLVAVTDAADLDAPPGRIRAYRATSYANDPAVASTPTAAVTVAMLRMVHALTAVGRPELGGQIKVEKARWSRPVVAGVVQPLDGDFPLVISNGAPKARRVQLDIWSLDRPTWDRIRALAEARTTLVYRDPFGEVVYCRIAGGDWSWEQIRALPTDSETTPLRHAHTTALPLVEIAPPKS